MKKPKVTIIIPVYKGEKYMREAIDSALAQTYDNLEILVINDGSPDNGATEKIAKSYGDKIKYMSKENGGVSTVLNMALREMKGEYFSWLSHDDVYYPKKIEEEVNYLIDNKLVGKKVILYSDYDLIDENSKLFAKVVRDHELLMTKPEYSLLRCVVNGITLLIPKIAFDECGNFDETLRCVQDYELWFRMMKAGYNFIHIPKILATTRCHSAQVTNTSPKVITEGNEFWIKMIDNIDLDSKIRLEGSEYNYYYEMEKFLSETPYALAKEHCYKKYNNIKKNANSLIKEEKVSVIIPFDENQKNVIKAVKSVLKQTHKNFEIILINYGVIKKEAKEIKDIVKQNKNIKLVKEKNTNMLGALNVGVDNSKGSYVAFLEPNNAFINKKLEIQLKEMVITNSPISHTSYNQKQEDKLVILDNGINSGDVSSSLISSDFINLSTVMINKKYLNDNNHKFDLNLPIKCFWLEILSNEKLLGIDIPLTTTSRNSNYSPENEILEIKSILKFVLSNDKLQKYDNEIAILSKKYLDLLGLNINTDLRRIDKKIKHIKFDNLKKPFKLLKKSVVLLKENGLKLTVRKVLNKIKK